MSSATFWTLFFIGLTGAATVISVCGFVFFGIEAYKAKREKRKVRTGIKVWFIISITLTALIIIVLTALYIIAVLALNSM